MRKEMIHSIADNLTSCREDFKRNPLDDYRVNLFHRSKSKTPPSYIHIKKNKVLPLITYATFVSVPPDILDYSTSTDMVVREGSNVSLRCAATGSPDPSIAWRREGGEPIPLGNGQEGKAE